MKSFRVAPLRAPLVLASLVVLSAVQLAVGQAWTQAGPPPRFSHTAFLDPTSKKMVVFGGQNSSTSTNLNDVWLVATSSLKFITATQLTPSGTLPTARYGHVATYNSNSNRMTVFGGGSGLPAPCLNDVWVLASANGQGGTPAWMSVSPSGSQPPARYKHTGVYDPNTNAMIVFGGSNCSTGFFNDVWVLNNADGGTGTPTWTQLTPSGGGPAARQGASAIYDVANNLMVVYGGDAGSTNFSDIWVLSNANGTGGTPVWSQLNPTGTAPLSRSGHSAIYDSVNNRMTVFGGFHLFHTLTDSFVLTFANGIGGTPSWTKLTATGTAPGVGFHTALYDSSKNAMYVFAGSSSSSKLAGDDHAFTLSNSNGIGTSSWTRGGPPARYSQSLIYDSTTNSAFLLDGQHAVKNTNFDDYWQASNVTSPTNLNWSPVNPSGTHPKARWGQSAVYDSVNNRLVMFAGATGFPSPCMNDYWVMTNANNTHKPQWVVQAPSGTVPAVRTRHSAAFDGTTNTLIVFGGYNCQSTYYNDVWVASDANGNGVTPAWRQLSPGGTAPSPRQSSSAVYNALDNTLTVFGGDAGGAPFGDIFVLSFANGVGGTPTWTQITASNNGPSARSGHTAIYDVKNDLMTIYGGYDGANLLSDAWVLSGASGQSGISSWTQIVSQNTAPPRQFASAVYDSVSNQMIIFGGIFAIPVLPDDHLLSLTHANGQP